MSYNPPLFVPLGDGTFRVKPAATNDAAKIDPSKYSTFENVYTSYAGTDITAMLVLPNEERPMILGELQTISYSIHRENTPVRFLGHVNVAGFVKGPRTIAGSMIFTQFNQYAFYKLRQYKDNLAKGLYPVSDMLPPFDVVLSFANEYGAFSKLKIYGITIVDEGSTMSVDDLITEQTFTYMARGIQPLVAYIPEGLQDKELTPFEGQPLVRPKLEFN